MFNAITVRGVNGRVVYGYHTAATLRTWSVTRSQNRWSLRGAVTQADRFQLRQPELLFQSPRLQKPVGFWVWPVLPYSIQVEGETLTARLAPPEGR